MTLLTGAPFLFAQEQESKLIDRLLKPNMSLANPIQNKQFSTQSASVSKSIAAPTFQTSEASSAKSFGQVRVLSPGNFAVRHFRTGDATANITPRSHTPDASAVQIAPATSGTRLATENGRTAKTGTFPDDRPFLGQGKSQKALHGYDRPLTIEQVRELFKQEQISFRPGR